MKTVSWFVCALSIGSACVTAPALADDPRDPTMRHAAARARDSAIVKQLNRNQLTYVQNRDAKILQNRDQANDNSRQAYDRARAEYDRAMASWRYAVSACRSGRLEYCDN